MNDPVRTADGVIPVAADLYRLLAGAVVPRKLEPVPARQLFGKQAALEPDREIVLVREQPRPLECI